MIVLILKELSGLAPADMDGNNFIKRRSIIRVHAIFAQFLYKALGSPDNTQLPIVDQIGQDIVRNKATIRDKDLLLFGIAGTLAAEEPAESTSLIHLTDRLERSIQKNIIQNVIHTIHMYLVDALPTFNFLGESVLNASDFPDYGAVSWQMEGEDCLRQRNPTVQQLHFLIPQS